jgi:hypothetical protein
MKRKIDRDRPLWPETVVGGKYVHSLEKLLHALRPPDAHGNRILHADDVLVCSLLAFFNPSIRSLRTVEDFSATQQAQRYLSIDRIPKSTLSDFQRVADSTAWEPIIALLKAEVERQSRPQTRLPDLLKRVMAVDGSFFSVAADVAWAFKRRSGAQGPRPHPTRTRRAARLDVHLDVATWLPEVLSIAEGESEAAHARAAIVPGAIHVYDRGIFSFELVAAHAHQGASFVHRLRAAGPRTPCFEADEERPLTDADRKAGVISDRLGHLTGSQHRAGPPGRYREVIIAVPGEPGNQVRLLTDVLDVAAHVIGLIYQDRWQVELFFRWLKSCARFRGVFSEAPDGIRVQFYICLIAMLLIYLRTGMRPSKYALNLLGMVVAGTASWEEIEPILARRSRERDLARACLERKRAAQPP